MSRIITFFPSLAPEQGGTVAAILGVAELINRGAGSMDVWTFDQADHVSESTSITQIDRRDLLHSKSGFKESLSKADCVYLHTPWCRENLSIARLVAKLNKPYVIATHGMLDEFCLDQKWLRKRVYFSLFAKRLFTNAARVHCTAEYEKEQVIQVTGLPESRVKVYPLPVNNSSDEAEQEHIPDQFQTRDQSMESRPFTFLFFGRINPIKNIEFIIEAFSKIIKTNTSLRLVLAGPSDKEYERVLRAQIAELDLHDAIEFTGIISATEKRRLFNRVDAAILVSHHENFGIAIVEAIRAGLPAIVSDKVAIWKELCGGGVSVVKSVAELSQQMKRLSSNPDEAIKQGIQGQEFVASWLNQSKLLVNYETLFSETY